MGVMECYRNNCTNIMCDTYIKPIGYICDDCVNEFKKFIGDSENTEHELMIKLSEFMKTTPGKYLTEKMNVDAFFESYRTW